MNGKVQLQATNSKGFCKQIDRLFLITYQKDLGNHLDELSESIDFATPGLTIMHKAAWHPTSC